MPSGSAQLVLEQLRAAFENRDIDSLSPLLADDVRWGDDNHPNRCRNRKQVLNTFRQGIREGELTADITEMVQGPAGILCALDVHGPDGRDKTIFQVYLLRGEKIAEIWRYDDRPNAAKAVGI